MGDYICKMKNGGVSYDISDAVADIEVIKGKNVRFVNVQVYVYKYMWTSSSFWLSNVKVEGGSINSASDIPTLNDNSTLISVDSYGGKYEDLILKQSSSSGDYYILECYTQATSLVNTTLGAISPSIQITQKGQRFTFQLVDPDGTSEDSGWHAEPNFEGSGYPRGVTPTNDGNDNNPITVKVVSVFEGKENSFPSNRKMHVNGDPVVWTQRVYISKTYTASVNSKNEKFTIKYVADFDFQAYSKSHTSWFNTRYNSSDNTTVISDDYVKVIKPSNYIEGSDEAVLEYIAMKGAGYSDIAMDIGYSYIPAPEDIMKTYSDSREIVNREIVAAFSSDNVAKLRTKPNQTASSEELQVALTNLFDIRGVCRYSPTVRLNLTANCDQALKAVCALTNRDGYFTDKAYFVNGIVNWLGYYRYYNKDDGKLYVKRQELSADEPRADPSTAVKLLQLDYHDNSYYKDRSGKKHPVDWVTDSRSTDVGSENLISIQKVSYSGGSCTFKIANSSNTSEGTEIVYDYPMDVDSETGKTQLAIIGLNSVVRSSTGSAAFQFAVMENTAAKDDVYTYRATFYPYCSSPDKLPKGADYENTFAVIHNDTSYNSDDLYKCTKNADNEYVYTMVTPSEGETCLITNPPYTGVWTFKDPSWVMGPPLSSKEVTRSALFTDYTVFEKVRDLQTTAYNGDDYASASNLQISYVKLSYPACITQYYIGNLTLTDTEQILSDLKSSASASINQNVISSAISDQSSSQIVVGNRQSVDVSSAGIKDSAFSGFIMKKNASASSANFTGYSNGTKQIRINSDGVLSCGTYFNNDNKEVGDAVILDKNGLRTYSYDYVDSSTSSTDYDYYKYTLQCEVNTKGELIAGANTYKLDAAGLSYNFPAKGWGTLLYYDDEKKKTVLNGSIYVKDAQIDSLSADKITSGTLNASTSIQVGTGANAIAISGAGSITGNGFKLNSSGLTLTKGVVSIGNDVVLNSDGLKGKGFDLTSLGLTLVGSGIYTGSIDDKSATSGVVAIDSKGIFFYEAGTSLKTAQAGSLADATAYITSNGKVMGLAIDSVETGNVKDNAITTDKIKSLVADKIETGVLKAEVGISSEGNICAGLYTSGAYAVKLDTGGVTTYDSNGTIQCKITTSGTNGGAFYAGNSTYLNATGLHGQDFNLTNSGLTLTGGSIEMPYVVIDKDGLRTYNDPTHADTALQCNVDSTGQILAGQGTVRMGSEGFRVYDSKESSANILVRASDAGFAAYVDNTEEGSRSALSVVHRPTSATLFDISSYKGSIYGDSSSNTNAIDIHVPSDSVLNASTGGAITSNTLRIYKTPWQTSSGSKKEYVFSEGSYPGDSVVSSLGEHTSHGVTDQSSSQSVELNNKSYTSLRSAMTEVNSGAKTILNVANGARFSAEEGDHCRFESTFFWHVPFSVSGVYHVIPGNLDIPPVLKFTVKSLATMDYHVRIDISYKDLGATFRVIDIPSSQESQISLNLSSHYINLLKFTFYTEFDAPSSGDMYGENVYFYNAYFEYTPADTGSEIRVWDDHLSLCGSTHILGQLVGNFKTDDTAQASIKDAIESIYPKATSFFQWLSPNVTPNTASWGGHLDLPNCRICLGYVKRDENEKYPSDNTLSATFVGGFKYPPIMTVSGRDAGTERNYPITVYTVSKSGFCFTTRADYAGIDYIAIGEKP